MKSHSICKIPILPLGIAAVLLLLLDRAQWATIMSWREDESTNLWLGTYFPLSQWTTGLVSSTGLANPNGMLFVGKFLGLFPNQMISSLALELFQSLLLVWFSFEAFFSNRRLFLICAVVLLTSYCLRANGGEPFNQNMMTLCNLAFFAGSFRFIRTLDALWLVAPAFCVFAAPSLYLAGILNAILFSTILALLLLHHRARTRNTVSAALLFCLIVFLNLLLVWVPYWHAVSLSNIESVQHDSLFRRSIFALRELIGAPVAIARRTMDWHFGSNIYSDAIIWNSRFLNFLGAIARLCFVIATAICAVFSVLPFRTMKLRLLWRTMLESSEPGWLLLVFAISGFIISPLVNGPRFSHGERPDIFVQFLPLTLAALIYFLARVISVRKQWRGTVYLLGFCFVTSNFVAGVLSCQAHLNYQGDHLSEADVPLIYKLRIVDSLVRDARQDGWGENPSQLTVFYDVGGGIWNFIPEFGLKMDARYKHPYTLGRGFDYDLRRRYAISNSQEGVQLRQGSTRYWIAYASSPPKRSEYKLISSAGRLRLWKSDRSY